MRGYRYRATHRASAWSTAIWLEPLACETIAEIIAANCVGRATGFRFGLLREIYNAVLFLRNIRWQREVPSRCQW